MPRRFHRRTVLRAGIGAATAAVAALIGGRSSAGLSAPHVAPSEKGAIRTARSLLFAFNPESRKLSDLDGAYSVAIFRHQASGWMLLHPNIPGADSTEFTIGPYVLAGSKANLINFAERNQIAVEVNQQRIPRPITPRKLLWHPPRSWALGTWTSDQEVPASEFMQWHGAADLRAYDSEAQTYYSPELIEPGQSLWVRAHETAPIAPSHFYTSDNYGPAQPAKEWQLLDPHDVVQRYLPVVFGESDERRAKLQRIEKWSSLNPPVWFVDGGVSDEDLSFVSQLFEELRGLTGLEITQAASAAIANFRIHLRVSRHFHHPEFDRGFELQNLGRFAIWWDARRTIQRAVVVVQSETNDGVDLTERAFRHLCVEEIVQSFGLRNDPPQEREYGASMFNPLWRHQPTELSPHNRAIVWLHHRPEIRPNAMQQQVEDAIRKEIGFYAQ